MRSKVLQSRIYLCGILALCSIAPGVSAELPGLKAVPVKQPVERIAELAAPSSSLPDVAYLDSFTPSAREISDLSGITPVLQELQQEQRSQSADNSLSLSAINKRQKLIYLREKLNTLVQVMNLQINSTRGKIDSAIAVADETRALLTERRNRMTHRNSQINLVSGGITKIVGYSLALSPITDIPTNLLEVFDGSVQTSLSGLALRQERQEAKLEHGMPGILSVFLNDTQAKTAFPNSIWRYLNELPSTGLKASSRRQELITNWQKSGLLARTNQSRTSRNLSIELLDQRKAMLSDLKSVIEEMHYGLMELNDSILASYKSDPVW